MSDDIKQEDYAEDYNEQQYDDDDDEEEEENDQTQEQTKNDYDEDDDDGDEDEDEEGKQDSNDDQEQSGGGGNSDSPKYVRLRGLPWSATHQEILDFLKNINVVNGAKGIHLITSSWDGKNTGEAYVEVQGADDVEEARKLNKASMGHRYIEVFTASPKEAKDAMRKTSSHGNSFVVKLRGLPYAVTEQQVEEFFNGLEIKPDREGILFVMDRRGRATGEAFVQFESQEDTEKALGRNREKIGHRYIEIFRSSLAELKRSTNGGGRPGPYDLRDRGGNRGIDFDGGRNNMRGGNDWGNGNFGMGANNTIGFGNLPNFTNSGNFGNGFGSNGGGGGGFGNDGGFGNNGGGFGGGNNRFNNSNDNFGNDFGDFGNFGNNRNNFNNGSNDFGGRNGNGGNFGNFDNIGGGGGGGNFGPIGGGRCDNEYFLIHMRGLPFSSYENDVFKFFDPIRPANVRINFNKKGLHSGNADTYFETYEDAQLAMKRHNQRMGSRYIELFFDGKTKVGGNSGGGGGGSNYGRRI